MSAQPAGRVPASDLGTGPFISRMSRGSSVPATAGL